MTTEIGHLLSENYHKDPTSDLSRAELFAWQQLAELNTTGYDVMGNYAEFAHEGHTIFDPWMKDQGKYGDPLPDHNGPNGVNPYDYYPKEAVDEFVELILWMFEKLPQTLDEMISKQNGQSH